MNFDYRVMLVVLGAGIFIGHLLNNIPDKGLKVGDKVRKLSFFYCGTVITATPKGQLEVKYTYKDLDNKEQYIIDSSTTGLEFIKCEKE